MRNMCFFFLPLLSLACVDATRDEPTDRTRDAVATSADASHDSDKDAADPHNADDGCNGDSCGKCLSGDDCGPNAECSTTWGECLSWCDCPECDVCAGQCVPITDPACGECTSDQDCKNGQICSVGLGDCLPSCDCPACDVCAGSCVDPANQ